MTRPSRPLRASRRPGFRRPPLDLPVNEARPAHPWRRRWTAAGYRGGGGDGGGYRGGGGGGGGKSRRLRRTITDQEVLGAIPKTCWIASNFGSRTASIAPIFEPMGEMSSSCRSTTTTTSFKNHRLMKRLPGMLFLDHDLDVMRVEATLKSQIPEIRFVEAVP